LGQDSTPAAEDNYDIYAAVVTGLSGTPVLGTPVLLAAGDGAAGSMGNRFPVIDGNLVAWSYHWGDAQPDRSIHVHCETAPLIQ